MGRIEIIIDQSGRVKLEVSGIKGNRCLKITRGIEEALGGEIVSREYTPEYYLVEETTPTVQKIRE